MGGIFEEMMGTVSCEDNLSLLSRLEGNSIDLIYSDVLYGTGRAFQDFKDLPPIREDIIRHYYPRFQEMYRVLKDTGTIYIQLDYRTSHWVRLILDEIFGYENFRNEIIWHYNSAPRRKLDLGDRHDTILRYSKSNHYTFNPVREPYSLTAPRGYEKEKYYHKDGKVVGDVWSINILAQNDKTERVGYSTQKPLELAERIISLSSNPGDVVADFYCGSGTTLVAALKLGRRYLGCDVNPEAVSITKRRIKNLSK